MSQLDAKPSVREDVKPYPVADLEEDEEELEISPHLGSGYVWAMKIPRFLLERWERVPNAGVELGTLVVDNSSVQEIHSLRRSLLILLQGSATQNHTSSP